MPKYKEERTILTPEQIQAFASRAKELREERGLSQEKLGECLGLSRSAISAYENGTRSPDHATFILYKNFFDVSLDYLVGDTDVKKTLYRIASSSNITDKDVGKLSSKAQYEIEKFIEYVLVREMQEKDEEKN